MTLSTNQLFLARDRVKSVLEAHLESQLALERANNIAQALVSEKADPVAVAEAMLSNQDIQNIKYVVKQVAEAWREERSRECIDSCTQDTLGVETSANRPSTSSRYRDILNLGYIHTNANKKRMLATRD